MRFLRTFPRPQPASHQIFPECRDSSALVRKRLLGDSGNGRRLQGVSDFSRRLLGDSGRLGGAARNTPRRLGNARRLHGDTGWSRRLLGDSGERPTQKDSLETREHFETLRQSDSQKRSLETPACGLLRKTPWRLGTTPETPWRLPEYRDAPRLPGDSGVQPWKRLQGHSVSEKHS